MILLDLPFISDLGHESRIALHPVNHPLSATIGQQDVVLTSGQVAFLLLRVAEVKGVVVAGGIGNLVGVLVAGVGVGVAGGLRGVGGGAAQGYQAQEGKELGLE